MTTRKKTTTDIAHKVGERAALVLLAGGSSARMGQLGKKEFFPLGGGTVLSCAVHAFLATNLFSMVAVVYPAGELNATKKSFFALPANSDFAEQISFVQGGKTRQESVLRALRSIKKKCKQNEMPRTVLIHDGARPFVSSALVRKTLEAAQRFGAAVPALEPVETQKEIDSHNKIVRHLQRKRLAAVQTPQGFDFEKILQFHERAKKDLLECTDDTEIWDNYAEQKTRVIPGENENIKITYPKDIADNSFETESRIGLGYDVHRLAEGRPLVLGGVDIPFEKGEVGHSDGDALLHAITDAVLGAAALGDIGSFFPDTDEQWRGADSKRLLSLAWSDVRNSGWQLQNLDCVIKMQRPKFIPYRETVRNTIAAILGVPPERIFVKAKTAEGLGEVGRGEAIECQAICLLKRTIQGMTRRKETAAN